MKFFKKVRLQMTIYKMVPWYILLFISFFLLGHFISSIKNKTPLSALPYASLFVGIASLVVFIILLRHYMNDNEYRELIRQANLLGDLESVGATIHSLRDVPIVKGFLRFNQDVIFYSNQLDTKIVIPSKITEISAYSYFYKCTRYVVRVSYLYENSITIEATTKEASEALCVILKKTVAPHLLTDEECALDTE